MLISLLTYKKGVNGFLYTECMNTRPLLISAGDTIEQGRKLYLKLKIERIREAMNKPRWRR